MKKDEITQEREKEKEEVRKKDPLPSVIPYFVPSPFNAFKDRSVDT
jgi:hypothetical protein